MKKFLLLMSVFTLGGCAVYSVENKSNKTVEVGDEKVEAGECEYFNGGFFGGFLSEYPVEIKVGDEAAASFEAGNYVVTAEGKVEDTEDRCEETEDDDDDDDDGDSNAR